MNRKSKVLLFMFAYLILLLNVIQCNTQSSVQVSFKHVPDSMYVEVYAGDQLFTKYLYSDQIEVLKKPVLYPVKTAAGHAITRGYPLDPAPGERVDHPHHIGFWLNYGNVNGLDFWNNSNAISEKRKPHMGTIRHESIISTNENRLIVTANWLNHDGETLLHENTAFEFHASSNERIIDRVTTLTALDEPVSFEDNKEGFVAIRVTRALEHPADNPVTLTDARGLATEVPVMDNSLVTGTYLNAEGVEGAAVWGKRSPWVDLHGEVQGESVHVVLMDHPDNTGYPTYWHARGYGLFAANPLGQRVFSNGEEILNFTLKSGDQVTFRYRLLICSGQMDPAAVEAAYQEYIR